MSEITDEFYHIYTKVNKPWQFGRVFFCLIYISRIVLYNTVCVCKLTKFVKSRKRKPLQRNKNIPKCYFLSQNNTFLQYEKYETAAVT